MGYSLTEMYSVSTHDKILQLEAVFLIASKTVTIFKRISQHFRFLIQGSEYP